MCREFVWKLATLSLRSRAQTIVTVTTAEVQTPEIDPSTPALLAQIPANACREEGLRKPIGADRPRSALAVS